jgi:hypothetical protein
VRKIEVVNKGPATSGSRPVIEIEGAGKEIDGVEVGEVLLQWSRRMKEHPLLQVAKISGVFPPTGNNQVKFNLTIAFGGVD